MSYFAKIKPTDNPNLSEVVDVIAAEQDVIDSGIQGNPKTWVKTSYNTRENKYYAPSPPAEPGTLGNGEPFRGNYATIGGLYDHANDVFYLKQPYPSWVLDPTTWTWVAPVPCPPPTGEGYYLWDESKQEWTYYPTKGKIKKK